MGTLEELRGEIDAVDEEIIGLLSRRESIVRRIVVHKDDEKAVRGVDRVTLVLSRIRQLSETSGLDPNIGEAVYRIVIEQFTELQMTELRKRGGRSTGFDVVTNK